MTVSPGCSPARQLSAIQAATPDSPMAATAASGTACLNRNHVVVRDGAPLRETAVAGGHPGLTGEEHPGAGLEPI